MSANRYAGKGACCGGWIEAEAGLLVKDGGRWTVRHDGECPPAPAPPANAAPGFYIRPADGLPILVVEAKYSGDRTYGKRLVMPEGGGRPSWEYERGLGISVADLTPMTAADAAALGVASGWCIRCCAKLGPSNPHKPTVSALVSALIGYGETCAANEGWPFPKGVKAQREYLATHGS